MRLLVMCLFASLARATPNIVMFLTDDQDMVLNGMEPMVKAKKWFQNGQTFTNAFVSTPVCCPSRSSLLTGRYQHNTHVVNNSRSGNCYGDEWTSADGLESRSTFASIIHDEANYETFYAGKYLNTYQGKAVPNGWDHWHGLIGNSKYYDYDMNNNGVLEHHGSDYEKDYLTDVIGHYALQFLSNYNHESPFLMVLAPPAPHAPFTPAPQHSDAFADLIAPRLPNFNHEEEPIEAKHWFVRRQPRPLNATYIDQVDDVFRNRWRTLLSVDDLVDKILTQLSHRFLLEDTFVFYASDHGYHLGNYGLPLDKRMPYDTDIRVPLMVRGPEMATVQEQKAPAVITLDLAPTLIDIAGLNHLDYGMDGISLLPYLRNNAISTMTRRDFLIEYEGEGGTGNDQRCHQWMGDDIESLAICAWDWGCKCQDSRNNTYTCLRTLDDDGLMTTENSLYCQFSDTENSQELYDLISDPYQLHNLVKRWTDDDDYQPSLHRLRHLSRCKGHRDCNRVPVMM